MRIATWNINSINMRLFHLLEWLRNEKPEVVLLQEIKTMTEKFPAEPIEELGYNIAIHGQKGRNGVAILSPFPMEDVVTTFPGDPDLEQSRYIEAVLTVQEKILRVASVYVPNGMHESSSKFTYKLAYLDALYGHLKQRLTLEEAFIVGGDYNVAPEDIDVYDPASARGHICFHPAEHARIHQILQLGLLDGYRLMHPYKHAYSWWDYRGQAFERNLGLRIDYLLCSPEAADRIEAAHILESMRKKEKPSDHAPVVLTLTV